MKADEATAVAVMDTLDRLADVYVTRDVAAMSAIFAPDPDVLMYTPGSDAVVGLSAIQAKAESDWSRSEAASLTYGTISISAAGPVAWAATEADFTVTTGGQESTIPVRITFVLERRREHFLIQHAHYSFSSAPSQG